MYQISSLSAVMDLTASLKKAVETDAGKEMYESVSSAVMDALDRSCCSIKLSKSDKAKFVQEVRLAAEQLVYTLMVSRRIIQGIRFHEILFSHIAPMLAISC